MFIEAMLTEILLPSLGNANDYCMLHTFKENIQTWMKTTELADLGEKKLQCD